MKKLIFLLVFSMILFSCKEEAKAVTPDLNDIETATIEENDSDVVKNQEIKKSTKQIKEALTQKGFKIFDYVDEETKDTILMQQYFMAFLKKGPIRGQNEEESAELQTQHLAHLTKMYELGYADISGPFGDDGDIRGITIYNVPTLKMADSLANSDPMVKAGRLEIEIHPWWAAKGFPLR
ncbi:YciI family protein [uncultured Algibacter sp.]|uniref:YciI family protein n=1 Tax=uncultured Algibacter sp. TaxID=298659 RepID=UPI0026230F75|nr:YciI family protein [uncultured Algibacter sp.]